MYRLPAAILLLMCAFGLGAVTADDMAQSLERLDEVLEQREVYIHNRQAEIDSLVAMRRGGHTSANLLMEIAEKYTSFNNDSALVFLLEGVNSTGGIDRMRFRWKYASLLPLGGFVDAALRQYDAINPDSVPPYLLAEYYEAGRQMHSYIAAFFRGYPEVYGRHRRLEMELQERLMELLPDESPAYKYHLGEYYYATERSEMAKVLLEELLDELAEDDNLRARAAHHLAGIANAAGDDSAYIYYLAASATSDMLAATREATSLQELGQAIFSSGEVARAYRYLNTALANAVECGARLRMVESSMALPIIEQSHAENNRRWRQSMVWVTAFMAFMLLVLMVLIFMLRHEMQRMRQFEAGLRKANTEKEVYISRFLQLCSIYMNKLNSFSKLAARKLAAGQGDELLRMIRSGKFVDEQSREFYDVFDNAFLHIYPDFPARVNALLQPDKQIELLPGEKLNTDLRILAFMRLGIEDSSRIAQVLNYSLNTIYAYRNRLKARAIDRDTFEQDVINIDSV